MDVVLNEILYDPEGADGGYEFVELAATGAATVDGSLAGWVLETGNGSTGEWRVAWTGTAIDRLVSGLFVIGESGVDPRPNAIEDLDLQNGPDACRLRSPAGDIDVVGWGAPLPDGFFEGTAAADVSGVALARLPDGLDTDDNGADLRAAPPTPGDFNAPASWVLLEHLELPPPGHPPGAPWTFRAVLRNGGREAWSGNVAVGCLVHPGEALVDFRVDMEDAIAPGGSVERVREEWPPPGTHLPRADVPGGQTAAWRGIGEDLVVSEALSNPGPDDVEWVELLSAGTSPIDLAATELRDAAGSGGWLSGVLAPSSFAVVAPDTSQLRERWGIPAGALLVELSGWPALNHAGRGDEVVERVECRLAASGGTGEPTVIASAALPGGADAGVSWERVSVVLSADDIASWAPSLHPQGATPGRSNSRPTDRDVDSASALVVSPRSFRPARDGGTLVVVRTGAPVESCRIAVHDAAGVRVAELVPWRAAPDECRAVWDGRESSGSTAPFGLYVVCARVPGSPVRRAAVVLAP